MKAKRLGVVEDPGLADIYSRAQKALYTAPTDLVAVASSSTATSRRSPAPQRARG